MSDSPMTGGKRRIDQVLTADQQAEMERRREQRRHRHRDCERDGDKGKKDR